MSSNLISYAYKYGESDLQRLGIFIEMGYLRHEPPIKPKKKKRLSRTLPVLGSCSHPISSNQDGYFDSQFIRVFDSEYVKKDRKKKRQFKTSFIPAGPGKKQSGAGDYWGCFFQPGQWPESFSPITRERKKNLKLPKPNPVTNPAKKGGPGYVDITLNPYPDHIDEPPAKRLPKIKRPGKNPIYSGWKYLDYFDPSPYMTENDGPTYIEKRESLKDRHIKEKRAIFLPASPGKLLGGCFDGGFNPWPKQENISANAVIKNNKKKIQPPVFLTPGLVPKTLRCKSILDKTKFAVNATNWREYTPNYVKYL